MGANAGLAVLVPASDALPSGLEGTFRTVNNASPGNVNFQNTLIRPIALDTVLTRGTPS